MAEREADMGVEGGQTLRKTQGTSEDADGERKNRRQRHIDKATPRELDQGTEIWAQGSVR